MTDPPFERIGIVGLGLIGGSIAQGIRRTWPGVQIAGVDRPEVTQAASRSGLIDTEQDSVAALTDADLVVLAAPVPDIVELLKAASRAGLRGVLTDVGSTKRRIMQAAADAGLGDFVGGHPIAGAERGGFDHARPDLFEGRPWLLVTDGAPSHAVARVEQLVRGLGADPRHLDAQTHDRTMAYVSHLPQLLAVALMNTTGAAVGEAGLAVSGRAFAEMTRLAASPPDLWRGILESNADFVSEAFASMAAALEAGRRAPRDFDRLADEFERARTWRERMIRQRPADRD